MYLLDTTIWRTEVLENYIHKFLGPRYRFWAVQCSTSGEVGTCGINLTHLGFTTFEVMYTEVSNCSWK